MKPEVLEVDGREVRVTNPDKVYFPAIGLTKLDLVRYYLAVGEAALRGVQRRPTVLKRYVDGIAAEALAALPDGAVLANVARGELIDEPALRAGIDRLGGVALDVYVGEFEHAPPDWLWHHPRVLITPHVSGGGDQPSVRPFELFVDNLRAFLAGQPLHNTVDWSRGSLLIRQQKANIMTAERGSFGRLKSPS